jgi:hypothetical protein
MLHRVAIVRTDVSEEPSASFVRVTRIGELGTTPAITTNRRTLRRNTTRRNIPEDTILHSHRRENLKYYKQKEVDEIFLQSICLPTSLCFYVPSQFSSLFLTAYLGKTASVV